MESAFSCHTRILKHVARHFVRLKCGGPRIPFPTSAREPTNKTPMKTILSYLTLIALAGSAFAGDSVVTLRRYSGASCSGTHEGGSSIHYRGTGTPGAYYRSNLCRNAVILLNDTPDFMTFFVYSGALSGPADLNSLVHTGAHVYEIVVPPYTTSFTDQRARNYWVCSKPGKWGIDLMVNRIVRS